MAIAKGQIRQMITQNAINSMVDVYVLLMDRVEEILREFCAFYSSR